MRHQETWLIGLNWWLTDYTRLKFNVTQSDIGGGNDVATVRVWATTRTTVPTITGFGMRAQVDW